MYQDDIENSSNAGDQNNAKKHCLRAYNQQAKENTTSSEAYSQEARKSQKVTNQTHKHFQSYPDENKPPPAKIANTKNSPPHSTRESRSHGLRDAQNATKSISSNFYTSAKQSFVIHQDNLSDNASSFDSMKESNYRGKIGEQKIPDSSSATGSLPMQVPQLKQGSYTTSIHNSKESENSSIQLSNNPNLDNILSRTSAAEFRNSCNDTIRSTSSPATDILERDDVFSLLHQHDILEDEDQMDDETTIQGGDENEEVIIGTSEADSFEAVIERPAQPVSEAVLISEEYSADILAHVKRTEVKKLSVR